MMVGPSLLMLVPLALIVMGTVVALALLLANPKTRDGAKTLLKFVVTLVALMIPLAALMIPLAAVMHFGMPPSIVSRPEPVGRSELSEPIVEQSDILLAEKPPQTKAKVATAPPTPGDVAEKGEDAVSRAAATKTVGFLRAMARVLGRALAEEEQILAAKKGTDKSLPAPAGRGAGDEGSTATDKTALTPALSQKERGPDEAASHPAWVNAPPQLIGDVYQMSIVVGPYTTRAECDAKLPEELQKSLDQYVNVCLGDQAGEDVRLPDDYLRQQLVKAEWEETRQHSVGPMTWLHVQLQFDRKIKDRILEEHRQAIIGRRLQAVATWSALALALVTVAFGYLKIDLATGGAYRGRLRLAATAAILGLVGVAVAALV